MRSWIQMWKDPKTKLECIINAEMQLRHRAASTYHLYLVPSHTLISTQFSDKMVAVATT